MRNVIWKTKYSMKALYECAKIGQNLQRTIIRFWLCIFIQFWIVFKLSAATKNLRTNYPFFLKRKCVLLIGEKRMQWQIFKVNFDYIRYIVTSINLFYCKTYTRDVFRTQSSIYIKAFLWFLQRCSIIDVRLGSKYATGYIQACLIEIICILNILL